MAGVGCWRVAIYYKGVAGEYLLGQSEVDSSLAVALLHAGQDVGDFRLQNILYLFGRKFQKEALAVHPLVEGNDLANDVGVALIYQGKGRREYATSTGREGQFIL